MRTRTRTILAGLVLAAALVGGVAWGSIPRADGTIQGCYRTSLDDEKGQLRLVDDPANCRSNETAIHWNERGVAGATGAAGPAGPQGAKGDNGSNGAAGLQGATGATGAAGPAGTNGTNGLDGAKGDACLPTTPACVGPQGPQGPQGATGPQGPAGAAGPQGAKGDTGAAGPAGTATTTYTTRSHSRTGTFSTAFCLAGERVTGGGGEIGGTTGALVSSGPVTGVQGVSFRASGTNATGWGVRFSAGDLVVNAFVICAS